MIAATEAMREKAFNLIAPSSSQGGASILLIVNGPSWKNSASTAGTTCLGLGTEPMPPSAELSG